MKKVEEKTIIQYQYALTNKVLTNLKLDEGSKVDKFFNILEKEVKTNIAKLNHNKAAEDLADDIELEELTNDLEDAKTALNEAYLAVPIEHINNNNEAKNSITIYLNNITNKQTDIFCLEEHIKGFLKVKEEKEKTYKDQLNKWNTLLNNIINE